ncbi:MAG: TorF family putative porin [Hyphomonadaceae bacterium]|nr:TorF family putative porin [Hyphomonadaceae bacterium]
MKKIIGVAMLASAAMSGAANAEVSGNIALVSDYVFRGVSLSDESPAVQGGFDWSSADEMFYAGVWGSSLAEGSELDVYGGWTPTTGPVSWDIGLVGYFYPGADDDGAEFDYFEGLVAGSINPMDALTLGAAVHYTPENYGETGEAIYLEANAGYSFTDQFSVSGAFGNQSVDDVDGPGGANVEDDYSTWNVGGTYALHGFTLDLRYSDTDIDDSDAIAVAGYASTEASDGRVTFSIGRAL